MQELSVSIDTAAKAIAECDALIIAAGAGMSVDSGLPDYRGDAGFWKAYPALGKRKQSFLEMATPAALRADPRSVWGFVGHSLNLYRSTRPHEGYAAILRIAERVKHGAGVYTSNVDGHFLKAGFPTDRLVECHGSYEWHQCGVPCSRHLWAADGFSPQVDVEQVQLLSELPTCPSCGGPARPNVLMFRDMDWIDDRQVAQRAQFDSWVSEAKCPVVLEIGANAAVPSVRSFALQMARRYEAKVIRINPDPTPWVENCYAQVVAKALPALLEVETRLREIAYFARAA